MKRLLFGGAVLTMLAIVVVSVYPPTGLPVDVAMAQTKSIREYVDELGKTRLPDTHQITMPLQGRILAIDLNEGDRVSAGQVVAKMEVSDLDTELLEKTNTVTRWNRNLEAFKLLLQASEETVRASRAKHDFVQRAAARANKLTKRNAISDAQMEEKQLQLVESEVDLRKDMLNQSVALISQGIIGLFQETDIAKQAKAQRDRQRAEIRCPVDGVVLRRLVSNERVLQPGAPLLEIGDLSQLEVEADVLTRDAKRISVGNRVDIGGILDESDLAGSVARIFPRGFTKVSSLGVEQQRVKVIVKFSQETLQGLGQAGESIGVEYRVRLKIYTREQDNAVTIPRAALFRSADGAWQVFKVRDQNAELTNVQVGLKNDFEVQIVEGLSDGDAVIVAPDARVIDGVAVEPPMARQRRATAG